MRRRVFNDTGTFSIATVRRSGLVAASYGLRGSFIVSGAAFLLTSAVAGLAVHEPLPPEGEEQ